MQKISEQQYKSLSELIYGKLMESEEMGMGEMGECRDEADRIIDEWLEVENITLEEMPSEQPAIEMHPVFVNLLNSWGIK